MVAGIGRMRYARFAAFNVFGGAGWVLSMTLLGYWLAHAVPNLDEHIEQRRAEIAAFASGG